MILFLELMQVKFDKYFKFNPFLPDVFFSQFFLEIYFKYREIKSKTTKNNYDKRIVFIWENVNVLNVGICTMFTII